HPVAAAPAHRGRDGTVRLIGRVSVAPTVNTTLPPVGIVTVRWPVLTPLRHCHTHSQRRHW
ncbi:MAG: hypothetical protein OXF25_03705, partial [Cyanobacteria bacterium MAG CAR3_bin_5]|nr:hypothetical protein [Cyanobacteria bacterium MAG CAR3_bin_5]